MEIQISGLGASGEGVGKLDNYTIFVEGALPGETVNIDLVTQKKTYGKGKLLEVITPSPNRVQPPCPVFGRCGGCQLQHLGYSSQLDVKRQKVIDALERIGQLKGVAVSPCQPSPLEYHYRNKIQLPVVGEKIGMYEKGSHRLVEIDHCLIHSELGEEAYQEIKRAFYHKNIRHLLIRSAISTNEVLVILVCSSKPSQEHYKMAENLIKNHPTIKGVVANINTRADNVILGKTYIPLCGRPFINETQLGLTFKISPASFFQVNPMQAEHLYQCVIEFASLSGKEKVLDAYCGVGTLALHLSKMALSVTGVECIPEAIEDAKLNAKENGIENCRFVCGDAANAEGSYDVVVVNPPRKGCDEKLLDTLVRQKPQKIIYVSCNPATLARDLKKLTEEYRVVSVKPFDMFPQTAHVETVVLLEYA